MSDLEIKHSTENALKAFAAQPLKQGRRDRAVQRAWLRQQETLDLKPNGLEGFCAMFDPDARLKRKQALEPAKVPHIWCPLLGSHSSIRPS